MSYRLRVKAAQALLRLGRIRAWRWLIGALQIAFGAGSRRVLHLSAVNQLEPVPGEPGAWEATGTDPQLATRDLYVRIPKGWCYFDARVVTKPAARALVYVDRGKGFEAKALLNVETDEVEGAQGLVRIPASTIALRLDPLDRSGTFRLGSVTVSQASFGLQVARSLRPVAGRIRRGSERATQAMAAAGRTVIVRPAQAVTRFAVGLVLALRPWARPRELALEPERKLAEVPGPAGRWHALGSDPRFRLTGDRVPHGWCSVATRVKGAGSSDGEARLVARVRRGREVELAPGLPLTDSGRIEGRVYVPVRSRDLLWDPIGHAGMFEQAPTVELRPITVFRRAKRREAETQAEGAERSASPDPSNGDGSA